MENKKKPTDKEMCELIKKVIEFYTDLRAETDLFCEEEIMRRQDCSRFTNDINNWRLKLIKRADEEEHEYIKKGKIETFEETRSFYLDDIGCASMLNYGQFNAVRSEKSLSFAQQIYVKNVFFSRWALFLVRSNRFTNLEQLKLTDVSICDFDSFWALKNIKKLELKMIKFSVPKKEIKEKMGTLPDKIKDFDTWKCEDLLCVYTHTCENQKFFIRNRWRGIIPAPFFIVYYSNKPKNFEVNCVSKMQRLS